MKELFKKTDKILKEQMDKIMIQFKEQSFAFYKQYMKARLIIDHGIRHKKTEESEAVSENA